MENNVDLDQMHSAASDLVYSVCKGLSVPMGYYSSLYVFKKFLKLMQTV